MKLLPQGVCSVMEDYLETLLCALDALPPDRVARIKSLKELSDKGFAKMKNWVGADVVSMCGGLGDELDFMKCLVRAVHEGVGAYKKTKKEKHKKFRHITCINNILL